MSPGSPIIKSVNRGSRALRNSAARSSYFVKFDVRPADDRQGRRVGGLGGDRPRRDHPRVGEHLNNPFRVLGGILGEIRRERLGEAVLALEIGHLLGDRHVALEHAEIGVGNHDPGDPMLRPHHSSSAKTRSSGNFRILEAMADPQSQKVQEYGQPRLVSMIPSSVPS